MSLDRSERSPKANGCRKPGAGEFNIYPSQRRYTPPRTRHQRESRRKWRCLKKGGSISVATTFTQHISARASLTIACALGLLAFLPAAVSAQGDAALPPPGTGGGPGWSVVPSSDVNGNDNGLSDVTCVSTVDCWAVGSYTSDAQNFIDQTLIEHFDGQTWSIVASANTDGAETNGLKAVSCVSATDCWAVGAFQPASGPLR